MAADQRVRYGQGAVYGSLAYDFDNPELYPEFEYGAIPRQRERVQTQQQVQQRTAAQTRSKQGLAPGAVLGMLVAAAMMVVAIAAQIQLMDISTASVELQKQLEVLETEQAKLQIAYESAFNLHEIEDYAIAQLGMQKPKADQIYYIDTSSPDRAEVVQRLEKENLVDQVSDFFAGIGEYFR